MSSASINKILLILLIPFFKLFNGFVKKREQAVVIFYTGKMGDMVCITPMFTAIKQAHKDSKLYLIARAPFTDILFGNPNIDEIITYRNDAEAQSLRWLVLCWKRLRKAHIVHFFNLPGSFAGSVCGMYLAPDRKHVMTVNDGTYNSARQDKSVKFFLPYYSAYEFRYDMRLKDFYLQMLVKNGMPVSDSRNTLFFPGDKEEVMNFLEKEGVSKDEAVIGVAIASGKGYKRWTEEKWVALLNILRDRYQFKVAFFGSEAERERILEVSRRVSGEKIFIVNQSLTLVPYFLKRCKVFISVDMGLSYIADAVHVPVVNIMGPVDEQQQAPENKARLVTDRTFCPRILKTPVTPLSKKDFQDVKRCFNAISPEMVFNVCKEFLE